MDGIKFDKDKIRYSLLPWDAIRSVVEVLEYGAKKYSVANWQKVPGARDRYFDAAQRHLIAWYLGENNDPESGLPHLAHCVCCILYLLWFQLNPPGE